MMTDAVCRVTLRFLHIKKKQWWYKFWMRVVFNRIFLSTLVNWFGIWSSGSLDFHVLNSPFTFCLELYFSIFWNGCCYIILFQYMQVFDSPHVQMLVGKRTRRRLDANSIVQLVRSFDAPIGILCFLYLYIYNLFLDCFFGLWALSKYLFLFILMCK